MASDSEASRYMNRLLAHHKLLWQWATTHDLANELIENSGGAFAAGNDKQAEQLRDLGRYLLERAKGMRSRYDKEDAPTWERLWELLERQGGW